jgi:hypothetical protein
MRGNLTGKWSRPPDGIIPIIRRGFETWSDP